MGGFRRGGGRAAAQPAQTQEQHGEEGAPTVEAQVMPGLSMGESSLVISEYNSMVEIAMRWPRDPKAALKEALDELQMAPELAKTNWYSIPYKNHIPRCPDRKKCDCPEKPVEGLSVKAAYNLQRMWKHLASKCVVQKENADHFILSGMARDLQSNTFVERPRIVYKVKTRTWDGRTTVTPLSEAEITKDLGAGASKAVRDAILNQFPDWWKKKFFDECRRVHDEHATKSEGGAEKAKEGIVASFAKYKVTKATIEKKLGHPIKDMTPEERMTFRGYMNALETGEAMVDQIFGGTEEEEHKVTPGQATEGKATATEDPVKKATTAAAGGSPPEEPPHPAEAPKPRKMTI